MNDYISDITMINLITILAMRRRIRGILMSGKQFSLDSHMDLVQVSVIPLTNEKILFTNIIK